MLQKEALDRVAQPIGKVTQSKTPLVNTHIAKLAARY